MNTNYPMRVYSVQYDGSVEWVAEYPDLPGCIGVGDSIEEAISSGKNSLELLLETARDNGVSVPEPSQQYSCEYSGKFALRLPKYLHRNLSLLAEEHNISLNQLCVSLLSDGVASINSPRNSCFSTTKEFNNKSKRMNIKPPLAIPNSWTSTGINTSCVYTSEKGA